MGVAKTKALISFAFTAKLICVFVFIYAKSMLSDDAAHIFHGLCSRLEPLSDNLLLSLNEDYLDIADTSQLTLNYGDTIAIIPPISGG